MRYLSARQMIFDAYQSQRGSVMSSAAEIAQLGARVQTTKRNNNDWRIVHGLEAGAVISAVECQPAHLQALARYCFGPFTREELVADAETVQVALYRQLLADGVKLPGQGKGKPNAQQLETLRYLCAAALYHHSGNDISLSSQRAGDAEGCAALALGDAWNPPGCPTLVASGSCMLGEYLEPSTDYF